MADTNPFTRLRQQLTSWLWNQPNLTVHNGLCIPRVKAGLDQPIREIPLAKQLVLPLIDYKNKTLAPLVATGDCVQRGDWLATGVIASANGCVTAVEPRPFAHPADIDVLSVVLATDNDAASTRTPATPKTLNSDAAISISDLNRHGVVGLGGAAFSTAEKVHAATNDFLGGSPLGGISLGSIPPSDISLGDISLGDSPAGGIPLDGTSLLDCLVINAAECEPVISCDEALMIEQADRIVQGITLLQRLTQPRRCIVAIEADKTRAIETMRTAIEHQQQSSEAPSIELMLLSPRYPSGAERQLIERVLGIHLFSNQRPTDVGVLCVNVATAHAVRDAADNIAMTTRIVTIGGEAADNPCNVRVPFGTPLMHVLEHTSNSRLTHSNKSIRMRVGGPYSGYSINNSAIPIVASTHCIVMEPQRDTAAPTTACIRCGACEDVCPAALLPQQLFRLAQQEDQDGCQQHQLDACILCGCCDVVCPSNLPLTHTFRFAKADMQFKQQADQAALRAEAAYAAHEARQQSRDAQKASPRSNKSRPKDAAAAAAAAAIAKARSRRKPDSPT